MADLPLGAGFGTLVHAVLEHVDTTTAAGLRTELVTRTTAELGRQPADVDPELLAGRPWSRSCTRPWARSRAAGHWPTSPARPALRARLRAAALRWRHPVRAAHPVRAGGRGAAAPRARRPAARLRRPPRRPDLAGQPLRGYLTGSIDSVLRVDGRFLIVDYKTNWLGPHGPAGREPLTAAHYTFGSLTAAMVEAHYPLQSLLYAVALHRYLRWRVPGYSPDEHLGGVGYLFLRGMCGPDTPITGDGPLAAPCGVFAWHPPAALVTDLSDLLDGGMP